MSRSDLNPKDQQVKNVLRIKMLLKEAAEKHRKGLLEEAQEDYLEIIQNCLNGEDALSLSNTVALVWLQLGNVYLRKRDLQKSIDSFRNAIQTDGKSGRAYNGLGLAFKESGDHRKAIVSFRKAIELSSDYAEAYFNLGNSLVQINQKTEAIKCYKQSLSIDPSRPETFQNLGNIYYHLEKYQDAVRFYSLALEKNKDLAGTHTNLGLAYYAIDKVEKATSHFYEALKLNPNDEAVLKYLGIAAAALGNVSEAEACFEKLLKHYPKFEYEILGTMVAPTIYDSSEMISTYREKLKNQLNHLKNKKERIEDPYKQVGMVNFILAMHGQKEKEIRKQIADFYLGVVPQLAWQSPNLKKTLNKKRIRVGFVSMFLHKHTIGNLYHGLIENLSRDRFHVSVFRFDRKDDFISRKIDQSAEIVVHLPKDIFAARKIVAAHNLDILFYPELGMDPLTYFFSFARMAPVQCKRGFQITMGIPNIDYFISSKWAEPFDAQNHYSEELVLLERTGYYYQRPKMPDSIPTKEDLGLPENKRVYACPQSLFKIHPDFDFVLGNILRKDPNGILVLLKAKYSHLETLLRKRFQRTIPDLIDRIYFISRMQREKFISLFVLADVVLDPIFISGGNTSLECFALGVPVVTWPSAYLPGRLTYGFYRQMGIMDCVARDLDHYAEIATELAKNRNWYNEIKQKLEKRSGIFFEDKLAVKEMEVFFEWSVQTAYGKKISVPKSFLGGT